MYVRVWLQVPAPFDKEDIRERLRKLAGGPTAPLNVHLRQEIDRLNTVVRLTTTTLKNLRLAVAGERPVDWLMCNCLAETFFISIYSELGNPTAGEGSAIISVIITSYLPACCPAAMKGRRRPRRSSCPR